MEQKKMVKLYFFLKNLLKYNIMKLFINKIQFKGYKFIILKTIVNLIFLVENKIKLLFFFIFEKAFFNLILFFNLKLVYNNSILMYKCVKITKNKAFRLSLKCIKNFKNSYIIKIFYLELINLSYGTGKLIFTKILKLKLALYYRVFNFFNKLYNKYKKNIKKYNILKNLIKFFYY